MRRSAVPGASICSNNVVMVEEDRAVYFLMLFARTKSGRSLNIDYVTVNS